MLPARMSFWICLRYAYRRRRGTQMRSSYQAIRDRFISHVESPVGYVDELVSAP